MAENESRRDPRIRLVRRSVRPRQHDTLLPQSFGRVRHGDPEDTLRVEAMVRQEAVRRFRLAAAVGSHRRRRHAHPQSALRHLQHQALVRPASARLPELRLPQDTRRVHRVLGPRCRNYAQQRQADVRAAVGAIRENWLLVHSQCRANATR